MNPDNWTPQNETDYQELLITLKSRIDVGNDPEGLVLAEYTMLNDSTYGRSMYLRAKANGWL